MSRQTGPVDGGPDLSDPRMLLGAYELLLGAVCDGGTDQELLRRTLAVIATVPWPSPHRLLTAALVDVAGGVLRVTAAAGGPADTDRLCGAVDPASCVCGEAVASARAVTVDGAARDVRPPCEPPTGGMHHAVPLASRDGVRGVLHAVLDPGAAPTEGERAFLARVGALLGAELQRRRLEEEHQRLENRFLQAQKLEAVGRLAGGVAHDFNNILTAITSYAELGLLRLEGASPLRRNLEEILAAADRAALLTQQLLAFSRTQHLAPRPLDLGAVVAEMGKMLRRLLGEDVELEVRAAPALPRVFADPVQVEQVVLNLALAARDALPGGGRIVIAAEGAQRGAAGGAALRLSFAGADAATLAEGRGERTGAGLGLAAVRGIVEHWGGEMRLRAEGGAILVRFPAGDGTQAARGAAPGAPLRGSETILLAEDDESVRCVIGECLRDLGYRVLETRGGREALAAAAGPGPIDLLLTDVTMPGMSGPQLLRELSASRGALPVLYVTGCPDEVLSRHGVPTRGAQLLRKPFSPGMLGERVRSALDRRGAPA